MEFRKASIHDIDTILAIHNDLFDYKWTYDNYANELKFDIASFMVLEENNQIIAYYITHNIFDILEIIMLVVTKPYQSKGLGSYLLDKIVLELKENGNDNLYLEVEKENEQAINFYKKHGFEQIDLRKDYYAKGKDALIMRKWVYPCQDQGLF